MKRFTTFLLLIMSFLPSVEMGQLLEENFEYVAGQNLTSNGWTAFSSSGTNPITVNEAGLTYSGYTNSNVGNAALLDNSGEDVRKALSSAVSTGNIYISFLVNVTALHSTVTEEYVLHLRSGTAAFARFWVDYDNTNVSFGLSQTKSTAAQSKTSFTYSRGTTYLIVIKYSFVAGTLNDAVSLWAFSSGVSATEEAAGSPLLGPITSTDESSSTSDPTDIDNVCLRQNNINENIIIDGIRVATTWSQAPLPVELTSFTALLSEKGVKLNWETATEVNNYGFEILRFAQNGIWEKIGFVNGHGNINSPKSYSFTDEYVPTGKVQYRLKQIDFDGKFEYSIVAEVNVEVPGKLVLYQNMPNPFNPVTEIKFALPKSSKIELSIYNMLGEKVQTLASGILNAGEHKVSFNAANLSSGVYFYKLTTESNSSIKKMILMK